MDEIEKMESVATVVALDDLKGPDWELRQELRAWMEQHNISQRQVAQSCAMSSATFSQWLNGVYKGQTVTVAKSVAAFLTAEREKSTSTSTIVYTPTYQGKQIYSVARMAQINRDICVIVGDSGLGKTTGSKKFSDDEPNSIFIEVDFGYTALALFREISEVLGLPIGGTLHDIFMRVVKELTGTGRLVIVDEAEHLPYRALELLRRLHDKAEIGILLVGMPQLLSNLKGRRGEFQQLYSRIGAAIRLENLSDEDALAIATNFNPDFGYVKKALIAQCAGNTRRLSKILTQSQRIAKLRECEINAEVISDACKMLVR